MSITTRSPGPTPRRPQPGREPGGPVGVLAEGERCGSRRRPSRAAPPRRAVRPTVREEPGRDRVVHGRHVIHKSRWRTADPGWKTSPRWGILARSSSRGDRWGTATGRASLRRLPSGRTRARGAGSTIARPPADTGCMLLRTRAGRGCAGHRVPRPGDRRIRPGVVDHHHLVDDDHHHHHRRPPAPTATTARRRRPRPKPDPDAFAALANQVSQNQAMLTQLTAQVDAGHAEAGRARAPRSTPRSRSSTPPVPRWQRLKQIVRDRAAYIYRHADTPSTAVVDIEHVQRHQRGQEVRGVGDADRRHEDRRPAEASSTQLDAQREQLETARAAAAAGEGSARERQGRARGADRAPEEAARPGGRDPGDG